MSGCEDFEILIEMRQHGALDDAGAARLEAHLVSCAPCGAFAEIAKSTEAAMQASAKGLTGGMDWERSRERVRQMADVYRKGLRRLVPIGIINTLLVWYY